MTTFKFLFSVFGSGYVSFLCMAKFDMRYKHMSKLFDEFITCMICKLPCTHGVREAQIASGVAQCMLGAAHAREVARRGRFVMLQW